MIEIIHQAFSKTWATKKLIAIYYLATLIAAAIIILPLYVLINRFAGNSQLAEQLLYGLQPDLLIEFLRYEGKILFPFFIVAIAIFILYWLFSLSLSAGALKLFADNRRFDASLFWGAVGRFFSRFLRLFFWSLLILLVLLLLPQLITLLQWLFFGKDPYEYISFYSGLLRFILYVIGLFFWLIVFDYGRIILIYHEERSAGKSLLRALDFIKKNFAKVISFAAILTLLGIIAFISFYLLADLLKGSSALTIVIIFFLQQSFIILRAILRLAIFAGETQIYQKYAPI